MRPSRPSSRFTLPAASAVPFVSSSILTSPSGVAAVTASGTEAKRPLGGLQVVICTGNEISRKTRATSAGLNGLNPRPPKTSLPRKIATAQPTTTIQAGEAGGRFIPSRSPVRAALPSDTVISRPIIRWKSASNATQPAVEVIRTTSAGIPK